MGDAAPVAAQAAYPEIGMFEELVQFEAMPGSVQNDVGFQPVFTDEGQYFFPFAFARQFAYDVEIHFVGSSAVVVGGQSAHQAVESVPIMHFGHPYQMQFVRSVVHVLLEWHGIEVDAVGNAYGRNAENGFCC